MKTKEIVQQLYINLENICILCKFSKKWTNSDEFNLCRYTKYSLSLDTNSSLSKLRNKNFENMERI